MLAYCTMETGLDEDFGQYLPVDAGYSANILGLNAVQSYRDVDNGILFVSIFALRDRLEIHFNNNRVKNAESVSINELNEYFLSIIKSKLNDKNQDDMWFLDSPINTDIQLIQIKMSSSDTSQSTSLHPYFAFFSFRFGNYCEDETHLTDICRLLSKEFDFLIVNVADIFSNIANIDDNITRNVINSNNDAVIPIPSEVILAECSHHLYKWCDPENTRGRTLIYEGRICIIPPNLKLGYEEEESTSELIKLINLIPSYITDDINNMIVSNSNKSEEKKYLSPIETSEILSSLLSYISENNEPIITEFIYSLIQYSNSPLQNHFSKSYKLSKMIDINIKNDPGNRFFDNATNKNMECECELQLEDDDIFKETYLEIGILVSHPLGFILKSFSKHIIPLIVSSLLYNELDLRKLSESLMFPNFGSKSYTQFNSESLKSNINFSKLFHSYTDSIQFLENVLVSSNKSYYKYEGLIPINLKIEKSHLYSLKSVLSDIEIPKKYFSSRNDYFSYQNLKVSSISNTFSDDENVILNSLEIGFKIALGLEYLLNIDNDKYLVSIIESSFFLLESFFCKDSNNSIIKINSKKYECLKYFYNYINKVVPNHPYPNISLDSDILRNNYILLSWEYLFKDSIDVLYVINLLYLFVKKENNVTGRLIDQVNILYNNCSEKKSKNFESLFDYLNLKTGRTNIEHKPIDLNYTCFQNTIINEDVLSNDYEEENNQSTKNITELFNNLEEFLMKGESDYIGTEFDDEINRTESDAQDEYYSDDYIDEIENSKSVDDDSNINLINEMLKDLETFEGTNKIGNETSSTEQIQELVDSLYNGLELNGTGPLPSLLGRMKNIKKK